MSARKLAGRLLSATVMVAATAWTLTANAVVIDTGLNTISIPGLTGFATTGAMMGGLEVTATFSGGLSETRSWAATGAASGGVTGTGWGLSVDGDTFTADWNFTISPNANIGQVQSILLNGLSALTVFDRTSPSPGTPGSASGRDFVCTGGDTVNCDSARVVYDYQVGITPDDPVGDLWQTLLIDFFYPDTDGGPNINHGPRVDFAFGQDTDNDSRLTQVPEPGTLALLGLALGAIGFARRRTLRRE